MFSGYVKPGVHKIYVYDPVTDEYLESINLLLNQREKDIVTKQYVRKNHDKVVNHFFEYGTHIDAIRSQLFGNLLYDYKNKVAQLAFKSDFNSELKTFEAYGQKKNKVKDTLCKYYKQILTLF